MFCRMDTPEYKKKGGITFNEFINVINNDLGDKESKEGIRRIFELMTEDPNAEVLNLNQMIKLSKELGENMSDEEIKDMLIKASKNGKPELTFEEFYEIMKKKIIALTFNPANLRKNNFVHFNKNWIIINI